VVASERLAHLSQEEATMNASELMTTSVKSCSNSDTLQRAAQLMWEDDCGAVPVVDADNRVVGIVTDRDICMAAYTQGRPLWQIPISSAMAKKVHGVRESDPIEVVETLMQRAQIRRVPVLDGDGRLKGILSMNDLARRAHHAGRKDGLSGDSIVQTLAAISAPRTTRQPEQPTRYADPPQLRA
jgi:CBS-domain-containing membrane protein